MTMAQWHYPDIETHFTCLCGIFVQSTRCTVGRTGADRWEVGRWRQQNQVVVFWLKCGLFLRSTNPMVLWWFCQQAQTKFLLQMCCNNRLMLDIYKLFQLYTP